MRRGFACRRPEPTADDAADEPDENGSGGLTDPPPRDPPRRREIKIMDGERELTSGLLSKGANFRLIVSGAIGVKEIERLIKKLELDKEILSDQENDEAAN